jgi:hypothetical protein
VISLLSFLEQEEQRNGSKQDVSHTAWIFALKRYRTARRNLQFFHGRYYR